MGEKSKQRSSMLLLLLLHVQNEEPEEGKEQKKGWNRTRLGANHHLKAVTLCHQRWGKRCFFTAEEAAAGEVFIVNKNGIGRTTD